MSISKKTKIFAIVAMVIILALTAVFVTLTINKAYASTGDQSNMADTTTPTEGTTTEGTTDNAVGSKAIAAAIAIGLAGLGGAVAMGIAIGKAAEGIAKQPEVKGDIRSTLMLGLVFIETVVIYALIVSILVVFVL